LATYRVGNGTRGNVGAEAIRHIVIGEPPSRRSAIHYRRRADDPESMEHVRQSAPFAFARKRAPSPATTMRRRRKVSRPSSAPRHHPVDGQLAHRVPDGGSIDGAPVGAAFEKDLREYVEPFRMAGHDTEIDGARFVPLAIEMQVRVQPDYFRSSVKNALLHLFSNRRLPAGQRGIFHPDNFTFGQAVYLSPLYAAAQAIDGVASVQITTFQRQGKPSTEAIDKGKLDIGRLEIARLDNDPNFPERGTFRLVLEGGK
jgi:hypothetical protein